MGMGRVPYLFDRDGRMRPADPAAIYFIVAEQGDGIMVVKIGFSTTMYQRYNQLLTGIAFSSAMIFAWAGQQPTARALEHSLHGLFSDNRLRREWFRFKQEEMPSVFSTASKEFVRVVGKQPEWRTITEAQAMEYLVQTKSKARARAA